MIALVTMLATPFRLLKVIVNCDKHVLFAENGTKSMHPLGKPSFEKKNMENYISNWVSILDHFLRP